jgi:coenzyme F420-0:L-glutamate ligase / coenzyme F420-1:gamma-L-glutamate ligase
MVDRSDMGLLLTRISPDIFERGIIAAAAIDSNGNCREACRDFPANLSSPAKRAMSDTATLIALTDLPLVKPGDDLAALLAAGLERRIGKLLSAGDVLVVAQKIVSKAEGRYVDLARVEPGAEAERLARETDKDPRFVQVILDESRRVVRHRQGVLIVEHRLGYVMANAGVDRSNVDPAVGAEPVLLLPKDPDASAAALREKLGAHFDIAPAVIISDSFGRAWRNGTAGIALGAAGLPSLIDKRGHDDLYGRTLRVTEIGFADEIAAAASLLMGQADEAQPAILMRGLMWSAEARPAKALIRAAEEDLFR